MDVRISKHLMVARRITLQLSLVAALAGVLLAPLVASADPDGIVNVHAGVQCGNWPPTTPEPVPVTDSTSFVDNLGKSGLKSGESTATVTASNITGYAEVFNGQIFNSSAAACAAGRFHVTDLIFHSTTGNGGTADVQVYGHWAATRTGGDTPGCNVNVSAYMEKLEWFAGNSTEVLGSGVPGFYDGYTTSPVLVSVPLDTPLTFQWGLNSAGCLSTQQQGTKTISAEVTIGDISGDIFNVTNVNATGGGDVVDIESVMFPISGNQLGGGAPVPSLAPLGMAGMTFLLGSLGAVVARFRR